jgi:chromosome segregation ATPase
MRERGFTQYALLAGGIVVAVLSLACYALYERGNAANARADAQEKRANGLAAEVASANETIEALQVAARVLDEQLVKIRAREATLNVQKQKLQQEYDALTAKQSEADKACLDRDLPDAFAERLRNDRPAGNKDGKAEGPGKPADAVREVGP